MKTIKLFLILALTAFPVLSANAATRKSAIIPFVNYGSIRNWEPDGRNAILLSSWNNRWYKATLLGPCFNLDNAISLGVVSNPMGDLDRFSSLLVNGQQCQIKSLEAVPAPESSQGKAAKTS